jgi:hypothetical protein
MANVKDTLCACGCQQICKPGNAWIDKHRQRLFPPRRSVLPLLERFWAKVAKTETCWLWTGVSTPRRYGLLWQTKQPILVHRFSYELHYGPIPDGLWVLHTCDTPACVRPEHLFLGTNSDNMLDAAAKGRMGAQRDPLGFSQRLQASLRLHPQRRARGERNHTAKLTEAQVREIRHIYAHRGVKYVHSGATYAGLARAFGVSPQTVEAIVKRQTWRHLDP